MIVQTFYNEITQAMSFMIDAAAEGTLTNKMEDEAYILIEKITLNNFQWSNERG